MEWFTRHGYESHEELLETAKAAADSFVIGSAFGRGFPLTFVRDGHEHADRVLGTELRICRKPILALLLGCLHLDRAVASDDNFHVTPIYAGDRTDDSVSSGLPMADREGLRLLHNLPAVCATRLI